MLIIDEMGCLPMDIQGANLFFQLIAKRYEKNTTKHGSSYLRYAMIKAAMCVSRNAPEFKSYFAKKRAENKHYFVATSHTAKKLTRVIFGMPRVCGHTEGTQICEADFSQTLVCGLPADFK